VANDFQAVVEAVHDLTRVVIATQGGFESRADIVRRLAELSIAPVRIASILAMPQKDVHSVLAKARKKSKSKDPISESENGQT
jgi:hypothetical protein